MSQSTRGCRREHRWLQGVEQKFCSICGHWRELIQFRKNRYRWDGLTEACKVCLHIPRTVRADKGTSRTGHRLISDTVCKLCCRCKQWLSLDKFNRDAQVWDGFARACRECINGPLRSGVPRGRPRVEHDWSTGIERKRCPACKQWLSLGHFCKNRRTRDGLCGTCSLCSGIKNPGGPAGRPVRKHDFISGVELKHCSMCSQWLELSLFSVYASRWDGLSPCCKSCTLLISAVSSSRRRARKDNLPIGPWSVAEIIERDGFVCWVKGCAVGGKLPDGRRDWAVDHLIPLDTEYVNHPGTVLPNLAIACVSCNSSKRNKLLPSAIARYKANVRKMSV